jgi:putative transposase
LTPRTRKQAVTYAVTSLGRSIRKACLLVGLPRASYDYRPAERHDNELRERIRELAHLRRRFGCPRIHLLLRREGFVVNHKRTERIYREEGLSLRKRKRKKMAAQTRIVLPVPTGPNERWSMDFVTDSIVSGRHFRALVIVDDYSRECPAIEVDTSLGGIRVVQVLEQLAETRGLPQVITVDNGPEFTSRVLDEWAYRHGVKLHFIRSGKPIENAYAESFIGRLRDECLNESWFITLKDARTIIESWRIDYNNGRPHTSLGGLTPTEFIEKEEKILTAVGL